MMAALEAGAEDVSSDEESFEILTDPSEFDTVKAALEEQGFVFASAEIAMVPKNTVTVTGDDAANMLKMLDVLEDNDDVQNVYTNMDIPEEELAKLGR
jgi:transcriptional/translational regulatory protein YebC/TACO1